MWIESHQSLRDHPKTRKLARRVGGVHAAVGLLHCLWWWCLDYAPDGDLTKYDAEDIAIGADWDGDPDELLQALTETGFLVNGDGLHVHDWYDYGGKLLERRERDRERKRHSVGTPTESAGTPPLQTNIHTKKEGRVIHSSAKAPVDNCPKCFAEHIEKPLEPDGHCALCGYRKRAK